MVSKRIIPTMLVRGRELVKGQQFNSWRSVGVAAQAMRIHAMREVDELLILDIGATKEGRGPDLSLIEELSEVCFIPLAVGGGIKSLLDVRDLLHAGADKVVLGTSAFERPMLIKEVSEIIGAQSTAVSLDVKEEKCWTRNGTKAWEGKPKKWARLFQCLGAGEILLQSIDRDGTTQGYDLDLIRAVTGAVSCPTVVSGGCSGYEDMRKAIEAGADAVSAGALFQFTDATPRGAAEYLNKNGVSARCIDR